MTAFRNIVLIGAFFLAMFVIFTTMAAEDPADEARLFLKKLEQGDVNKVLSQFGDNTCNCQPRGGYIAYLLYQSGEQNNLSPLLSRHFTTGNITVKAVPTRSKYPGGNLPWEQPESTEVDIPINFEPGSSRPYFLPLDTAFGHQIKEEDFNEFCRHPEKGFEKSLSLRIRPTLKPGLIPPQMATPPGRKPEFTADMFMTLLPAEQTYYLRPCDAGTIKTGDGKVLMAQAFEERLPRLKAVNLKLLIGRRSKYKRWTVSKGFLRDPEIELSDGKVLKLKSSDWQGDPGANLIPTAKPDARESGAETPDSR